MAASYPTSVRSFSTKVDFVTPVVAADPNSLQEEVVAIESILGLTPNISTYNSPSGVFQTSATTFNTVALRLANIEQGIVADTHIQYLKRYGNETIINTDPTKVTFTIKAQTGQTASLLAFQDALGNTVGAISPAGALTISAFSSPEINNAQVLGIFAS